MGISSASISMALVVVVVDDDDSMNCFWDLTYADNSQLKVEGQRVMTR